MAKLIFRFGAMGASKTANALMVRFNYEEREQKCLLLKPGCECRDGINILKSRIGLEAIIDSTVEKFLEDVKNENLSVDLSTVSAIIVDEVQFLDPECIDELADIVDTYNIPIICYGLKTDFRGNLFESSKRLIELADNLEEIPTICWCGKKARFNARIENGKVIKDGEQVQFGGNSSYISLCRKHFLEGNLGTLKYVF